MKNLIITALGVALFVALAIGILVALKQVSSQPSVILTSTNCEPPCWYGIQPGKTNYLEITGLLEQISGLNERNILWDFDKKDRLASVHWTFQRPIDDSLGYIYFDDDKIVNAIKIYTINSLKISDVFKKLGEPELFWTEIGKRESQDEFLEVFLLYPAKGYLVDCIVNIEYGNTQVELKENTPIYLVTYFAPEAYNQLLETQILIDKSVNTRSGTPRPWPGLGLIPIGNK